MIKLSKLFISFSLILWGQVTYAADGGLYIGIDASYEIYDDNIAFTNGVGSNLSTILKPKGVAPSIFVGLRENAGRFSMAVEARYGYAFANEKIDPSLLIVDGYKFSLGHTISIAILPGFQITNDILLYTRFGYVTSQYKEEITDGAVVISGKAYQGGFEYGVGFQIDLSGQLAVRAEYILYQLTP